MSYLKQIVVELHNCLDEFQPERNIPMVWSKEFATKLAQNTDHWKNATRRASHIGDMDFQSKENIRIPYQEEEEDGEEEFSTSYGSAFRKYLNASDDVETEEQEEIEPGEYKGEFKTKYGEVFRQYLNKENDTEEQEEDLPTGVWELCQRCQGEDENCPRCGGIALKDVTGSHKRPDFKEEQQEEGEDREDNPDEQDSKNKAVDDQYGEDNPNDNNSFADEVDDQIVDDQEEWDDPDYQGVIRTAPDAHLVSKRQQEDGTFDELWVYNVGQDFKSELKTRRAVLAGTDIPINKMKSPDGSQNYELWTVGNGQMLKVRGLPN